MGVLDIRMRSEKLQNIGGIQMPHVYSNNMAGQDWAARSRIGSAIADGAARIGNAALNLGVALQKKEDQRQVDIANAEIQKRYNSIMLGDGTDGSGAMNEDFTDGKAWLDANAKAYNDIVESVRKQNKLTDYQLDLTRRSLASYENNWIARQSGKASAVYEQSRLKGAVSRRENAELDLSLGSTPEGYMAWVDAVNEELDVSRVHDADARQAYFRKRGLAVVQNEMTRRMREFAAENAESEDSKAVGEFYDAKIKEAEENPASLIPQSEGLKAALGPTGIGAPANNEEETEPTGVFKAYLTDLKQAKQKAMHAADALRHNKSVELNQASHSATASIELDKDGMSAAQIADAYRAHLDAQSGFVDKNHKPLTWREAYKEYSQVRGKAVQRAIDVYDKESKRVAKGAAAEETPFAKSDAEDALWYVQMQKKIVNAERDKTDPTKLMEELDKNQNRVTAAHYLAMYNDLTKKRDAQEVRICNEVFTEFLNFGLDADHRKYVSLDTFAKATDTSKRGTKESVDAVKALLGSPKAEYIDDSWTYNPNFTIEDVDAAVAYVKQYLKGHPNDKAGAKDALMEIVNPISRAARARQFQERILQHRRKKTYSSLEAFKGMK